jgi:hypothetical protein
MSVSIRSGEKMPGGPKPLQDFINLIAAFPA